MYKHWVIWGNLPNIRIRIKDNPIITNIYLELCARHYTKILQVLFSLILPLAV